jgi:diguanylate cyclase (GGDEF)-like protein/PAS domain S-box-containing protein
MGRSLDAPTRGEVFRFDQSDALLRKVMENAAVGMALIGRDRRLIYVNPAFAEMLGRASEDCLGGDIEDFVHPDCDTGLVLQLQRLMRGEVDDYRAEARLKHSDGSAIWVLASASDLRSEQTGNPLYVILQVTNVDRQKRAEAALAHSESRWNFALEAAGQGVWDFDGRSNTVFYSNQWRRMRGIPAGEQIDPAQDKWLARVHPEDVPRILSTVDRQNKGEEGFDTLEYRERHRDGHWLWILSRGKPVEWDENGKAIRTIGTDTDITRIKTVEGELAAEKERLRVTLESIGDGVISTDAGRRIAFMNPAAARMTGWSASDAVGKRLDRVFTTVDETTGAPAEDLVATCLETGDVAYLDEDVVLVGRDGARCDIRSSVAPLRTPGGKLIGCVLAFQDVTNSRTLQRQLAHSATHDALTGLPNRVAFERALAAVAAEAQRDNRVHALCFIDLDRFKAVNDSAGHAAGDALLRQVGDVIRRTCRRQDFAARIGGDEFAVLLADCPIEGAQRVAQKLVDAIGNLRFRWEEKSYQIGASVGITDVAADGRSPMELMSESDAACYVAKASGRGQVAVYSPSTPRSDV